MDEKIPVYFINGFLEAGKTNFINFTVGQDYFSIKGTTLLIVCEEGLEEYDEKFLKKHKTVLELVENEEDLTEDLIKDMVIKHRPSRIIVEYNGMWRMASFPLLPYFEVEQQITIVDGNTFTNYFANMKSLFAEMVRNSELVLVNRCDAIEDYSSSRRAIKALATRAEVVFENVHGEEIDFSGEDLPYDYNAPVIEISDENYGIWFFDALDHRERYEGKTVLIKGMVLMAPDMPKHTFIPGRMAMTCCADDISFLGFLCKYQRSDTLTNRQWVSVKATVTYSYQKDYGGVGPVLSAIEVTGAKPADVEVLNFN